MRFRLFRSRAFWFGVPGLVFLLWGWWVSMGHRSWVAFDTVGIGHSAGEVYAYCFSDDMLVLGDMGVGHYEVAPVDALEWKKDLIDSPKVFPDFRVTFVPYYWMIVAYVAGWAGLVLWRSRKYRSLLSKS